ncbi:NAD(+)/NADH kinase [Desulfobacterales bacterium HSG16]|nr:NAD(+)/NADH kinase [Desulfobacterales bacterium HSG16]
MHILKKIGLFVKMDKEASKKAEILKKWLGKKNINVVIKHCDPPSKRYKGHHFESAPDDLDCVFALGGDGTFLSAVRWIGRQPIPIHGIKFGQVGFLAETSEDGLFQMAEAVLAGLYKIILRMRLEVSVFKNESKIMTESVLNDLVINKGALARLAQIDTWIDDKYLTTYRADGLIMATPTGSTAYSLAAGGPVVHPAVPGIIMTPICPFTLTNRPLIIPDSACVRIRLSGKSSDIMLTFDGQSGLDIDENHTIIVKQSTLPVQMITLPDIDYFDILKAKLRWSGGRV